MPGLGRSSDRSESRSRRRRGLVAVSCVLVPLCCACAAVALASSQSGDVHGAGVSDLTGSWTDSNGSPYQLQSSSDRRTLTASWHGTGTHSTRTGSFNGTLNSAGTAYTGPMQVSEAGNPAVNGTMTMTIVSANELSVSYQQDNGVSGNFTLKRSAPAPSAVSIRVARTPAFDALATVPAPPPGGEAVDASPQIGNATDVTATETGVSDNDVAFYAAAVVVLTRNYCYAEALKELAFSVHGAKPGNVDTLSYINAIETGGADVFIQVAACMASADTFGKVLDQLAQPAAAPVTAATACRTTPVTLTVKKKRVRKLKVGGIKGVSVKCTHNAGVLKIRVHSKSGKPLRKLVGKRLMVGVRRSSHDAAGGQLGFMFHKG